MLSVQTNTTALSVQRFLNKSAQAQSSNQGKASSGSNIVRAADDAAGLAISNKMRADIASLRQGQKNASQGASLLQIANGATDRAVDILTRLKELASNNDLLGAAEKQFKQAEVNQLLDQLDAIATQTTVTGRAIMNGVDKALSGPRSAVANDVVAAANAAIFGIAGNNSVKSFTGNVVGQVTDARVRQIGSTYVAEIDLNGKTFRSMPVTFAANQAAVFIDTTNAQNRFTVDLTGTIATGNSGLYELNLRTSLGLFTANAVSITETPQTSTVASALLGTLGTSGDIGAVKDIKGGVVGQYKGSDVREIGSSYQIDIVIGDQTYRGSVAVNVNASTDIQFTSLSNDNNKFTVTVDKTLATGNAAASKKEFDVGFKFITSGGAVITDGTTVNFRPGAATEAAGAALLKADALSYKDVIRTSSATKADTYTLTTKYVPGSLADNKAEKIVFRLEGTDGVFSEAEITDEVGSYTDKVMLEDGTQKTLSFSNGVTLKLDAQSVNNMVGTPIGGADGQGIRFTVGDGEATILKFQTGIASTDVLAVGLDPLNVKGLGLTGISMEDNAKATDAVDRVDAALARVNLLSANIGAQQSRLDFTMDVNATTLENYQAANSVVRDADLSAVLTDLSQATLRNNVATAILSQANQTPTQTVSRLLQGL
ncbi:MAG: flagellin [Holosporales bacterium]|jgi:flagellin